MTLERGRRAASEHRALQAWRDEAVHLREVVSYLREQIGEARVIVLAALTDLGATGAETHAARTRLLEALDHLTVREARK